MLHQRKSRNRLRGRQVALACAARFQRRPRQVRRVTGSMRAVSAHVFFSDSTAVTRVIAASQVRVARVSFVV